MAETDPGTHCVPRPAPAATTTFLLSLRAKQSNLFRLATTACGAGREMAANQGLMSGGQLVVASLRSHGVKMAFSVAGESYLEVLDAPPPARLAN